MALTQAQRDAINKSSWMAYQVGLGDLLSAATEDAVLSAKIDSLKTAVLALIAKLDQDTGVTDNNYAATVTPLLP